MNDVSAIKVIHYGDPWCWFSWGLEPVIQRLHEVYGDQVSVVYKMGGVFNDLGEWREKYGVGDDSALSEWIAETDQMMRNPFDLGYVLKSGMKDTTKACIAVKAAGLQDEELMLRFYRKLMEAIQLFSQNGSDDEVIMKIAAQSELDLEKLAEDLHSSKTSSMFEDDRRSMVADRGNFFSLLVVNEDTGERELVSGYTSEEYEKVIDRISRRRLDKKIPIDIIEYFDDRRDFFVTAREISEVFQINEVDAEKRLSGLSKSAIIKKEIVAGSSYWRFPAHVSVPELTLEQVNLSHVTERAKVTEPARLEQVVKVAVQKLYTEVAEKPRGVFHFPVGREGTNVGGYPDEELNKIPVTAVESFAGVGYPHQTNSIKEGNAVLDVGSGSGTDLLVAAIRTGPGGRVTGLDMTDAMIEKARSNVKKSGFKNVKVVKGEATKIPLDDGSVDVVTSNGVLNLVPDKQKAFNEIFRVLKPGGRIQLADIVTREDVQAACGIVPQLWADCIGGASVERDYLEMIRKAGFSDVRVVDRIDYFARSPESVRRLTKTFGAESVVISAKKPI
jgi:SAM-dependent methyltransferase/predicted DsbA family dithiol-disulfide isomerase